MKFKGKSSFSAHLLYTGAHTLTQSLMSYCFYHSSPVALPQRKVIF